MSIEDLANIEITSVSKRPQALSKAPASIYVIDHDAIIRSGARSIPEMLRLAPNLQVAQINANAYAITARGFNSFSANKLLVLIDGRSAYSPYFQGVFWDVQDVPADNIDRIEVISGPGGTLWGANAVNGVINIITKSSRDTQGGIVHAGAGNKEYRGSVQYGGMIGPNASYRAYASGFDYSSNAATNGTNARDAYYKPQGGFRVDWTPLLADLFTFQGDMYQGMEQSLQTPNATQKLYGLNGIARWNHQLDNGSSFQLQAYYDKSARNVPGNGGDLLDVADIDAQHRFNIGSWNEIVWGLGYRASIDHFSDVYTAVPTLYFDPAVRALTAINVFGQDTIALTDTLKLTAGLKVEKDTWEKVQPLPSVRLAWQATPDNLFWAAASRAVRAPSRNDRDLYERVGTTSILRGGDFQSEKVNAYEIGYRAEPLPKLSLSVSGFYNVYQDLRSVGFTGTGALPIYFTNDMQGDTYGLEAWASYQVATWWRIGPAVNWLHEKLSFKPGANQTNGTAQAGDDPKYQVSLHSAMDLRDDLTLDLDLRSIGSLPNPAVRAYTELNARLGWTVSPRLTVSLSGNNLLHNTHVEFNNAPSSTVVVPVARTFFIDTRWTF